MSLYSPVLFVIFYSEVLAIENVKDLNKLLAS